MICAATATRNARIIMTVFTLPSALGFERSFLLPEGRVVSNNANAYTRILCVRTSRNSPLLRLNAVYCFACYGRREMTSASHAYRDTLSMRRVTQRALGIYDTVKFSPKSSRTRQYALDAFRSYALHASIIL